MLVRKGKIDEELIYGKFMGWKIKIDKNLFTLWLYEVLHVGSLRKNETFS